MKLLISDLDGTLYPKNKHQLQKNFDAVRKWINAGNKFAVATARGLHHLETFENNIGFKVNYIGSNGASVVYDDGTKLIKYFPSKVYFDLCKYIKDNNINASVATGLNDQWVWSSIDKYPKGESKYDQVWKDVVLLDEDKFDLNEKIQRIQIFVPKDDRDKLKEKICNLNLDIRITSSDLDMIDIGPLNSSKGISILELCDRFNIKPEDVIVIGDSENDIPMFELTPNSYCIDTAETFVLNRARYNISSVEELIEQELKKNNI